MRLTPVQLFCCMLVPALLATKPSRAQSVNENADFKLAVNLFNDKLYDLAAEQFKQFIASYPSSAQVVDARFSLGQAQLKLSQFDEARLTFQTFALTYPENPKAPEAWWNVGESYAAAHAYKEAALAFERVKVFHPKSKNAPLALLQAGKYFRQVGNDTDAHRVLRIVLLEYGSTSASFAARALLGEMLLAEGKLEQAQSELKRVVEGDPSAEQKARALLLLGRIYQTTGKADQAQSTYREIVTKYKSSSAVQGAYVYLATLEAASGKLNEAVDRYKKALVAAKTEHGVDTLLAQQTLLGLGDAYVGLREYEHAVAAYESFMSSHATDLRIPDVVWKAAMASSHGKNYEKSTELCNRLLRSDTPILLRRRALVRLALNAVEQKQYQQAAEHYVAFIEQYPDDGFAPDVLFRLASLVERELHDVRQAASYYERLLVRYRHSPLVDDACFAAARCAEEAKDFDKALLLYRQVVQSYPASEFRTQAEARSSMIQTFEAKDVNAGVEKLALLVGQMTEAREPAEHAFQLGAIYFSDLKNYAAAAEQFEKAVKSGLPDTHAADALFMRAKSFEYLTWKDAKYRQHAIEAYQSFMQFHSQDARSGEAALSLFTLRARDPLTARQALEATLSAFPNFGRRDTLLLRIGDLEEKADSAAAALATYHSLYSTFPNSTSARNARLRTAALWLKIGVADSAANTVSSFVDPDSPETLTSPLLDQLGDLFMRGGMPQRATEIYQRLAEDFGYTAAGQTARQNLARALLASGKHQRAASILSELIDRQNRNPLSDGTIDPSLLLALAKAEVGAGDRDTAKKTLLRVLAADHSDEVTGEALKLLGRIYQNEGSVDVAASYFKEAGRRGPAVAASRDIADLLYDNGNYADAIGQYQQLAQAATSDADRRAIEARIITARLRTDELSVSEKLIAEFRQRYKDADGDLASFELEKGNYWFRRGEYGNALTTFNAVADKYDETSSAPLALYWSGKTLEAIKQPSEAIEQFSRLVKRFPDASVLERAYLALGGIYYAAEKWDEAIQQYRKVVDNPKADPALLPLAMSNLIETYEAAGINDAALALARQYLERYPNSDDALDKRIKIGILYTRLGYYEQSILQLRGVLDEAGSDLEGEIRYYIADANYSKGDYQQAILDFLKVPYLVTKKGKIDWTANSFYMAGQSYEKMGRFDQAMTMYQQILDRPGIDETYRAAAKKEIDRVKLVLKK